MNKEMWNGKDIGAMLYVNGKPFLARRRKATCFYNTSYLKQQYQEMRDGTKVPTKEWLDNKIREWYNSEDPDTYNFFEAEDDYYPGDDESEYEDITDAIGNPDHEYWKHESGYIAIRREDDDDE